jgi:hypothetical protein
LETKPSFPVSTAYSLDCRLDHEEALPYKANFAFQIMQLVHTPVLIDKAIQIYAGLWNLTLTLDQLPNKAIRGVHVEFGDRLIQLEVQILELINKTKFNEIDDQDESDVLFIFSTAALIYLYTYLRANPRRSSNIIISKRLRQTLERIDTFRIAQVYPDLMLWALTAAGLETVDPDESFWYVGTAKRLCCAMGFYSKAQVNQIVRDFVWRENARDKHHIVDCTEFWDLVFTGSMYHPIMNETYDGIQILGESENFPETSPVMEYSQEPKSSFPGYSSGLPIWCGPNTPPSIESSMSPDSVTAATLPSISTIIEESTDSESEIAKYDPQTNAAGGSQEPIQNERDVPAPNLTVITHSQVCRWSQCNTDFDSAADLE